MILLIRRLVALCLVCGVCSSASAWSNDFWRAVKNYVDSADFVGCDTSYVRLPREGFTVYANSYLMDTRLRVTHASAAPQHVPFTFDGLLSTQGSAQVSLGVLYRGWGLSYSRDISDFKDSEWAFMTYGQSYGAEFRLHNSHSFRTLEIEMPDGSLLEGPFPEMAISRCHNRTFTANTYYVFNHQRFSLPAARSHTVIQRRSSGSWLAAMNYRFVRTRQSENKLKQSHLQLGGGYAYNWAWGDGRYLLNAMAMPTFSVWSSCHVTDEGDASSYNLYQKWLSPGGVAHVGTVINLGHWLTGVSAIFTFDSLRTTEGFSLYTYDWLARGFIGYRF